MLFVDQSVTVLANAIWLGEPRMGTILASPKSRILAWPRLVTKMLAGLMSRWTMPLECAASSASAISIASDRGFRFQRMPSDPVLQRHAVQKLHGDEALAIRACRFRKSCRCWDGSGRKRHAPRGESVQGLRVLGHFVGQEFQGDEAPKLGVLGLVDDAHPAAAQFLDDAVVRDGLADHWTRILRCEFGKSMKATGSAGSQWDGLCNIVRRSRSQCFFLLTITRQPDSLRTLCSVDGLQNTDPSSLCLRGKRQVNCAARSHGEGMSTIVGLAKVCQVDTSNLDGTDC